MSEEIDVADFVVGKIRDSLEEKGWNQAELSRRAAISPMNLSDILTRKTNPSLAVVMQIADAFEKPIDVFFPPTV